MITLILLASIGSIACAAGGAFTNGLDGLVLGWAVGFVLGVAAWMLERMKEQQAGNLIGESATFHRSKQEQEKHARPGAPHYRE